MANKNQEKLSILRRKQVEKRTGLSRSTIYLRIQEGTFPKPISLGARAVGWLEKEIDEWLAAKIIQRDNPDDSFTKEPMNSWVRGGI